MSASPSQLTTDILFQTVNDASPQQIVQWGRLIREITNFYKHHPQYSEVDLVKSIQAWRKEKFVSANPEDYEFASRVIHLSNDRDLGERMRQTFRAKVESANEIRPTEMILLKHVLVDLSQPRELPQTSGGKESLQSFVSDVYARRATVDLDRFKRIDAFTTEEIAQLDASQVAKLAYAYVRMKRNLEDTGTKMTDMDFFERLHQHAMTLHHLRGKALVRFISAHAFASSHTSWDQKDWKRADAMMEEHCKKLVEPILDAMKDVKAALTISLSLFRSYRVTEKAPEFAVELANCLLHRVRLSIETLSAKELADLISTLIDSGIKDRDVSNQLQKLVKQNLGRFSHREVVTMASSLAVECCEDSLDLISSLLKRINEFHRMMENNQMNETWSHKELEEINFILRMYNDRVEIKEVFSLEESLSVQIQNHLGSLIESNSRSSKVHAEIVKYLSTNKFQSSFNHLEFLEKMCLGGFFFNVLYPNREVKLAILIDKPTYFERNSRIYKKEERMREEFCKMMGFYLIRIPCEVEVKTVYLRKRIFEFNRFKKREAHIQEIESDRLKLRAIESEDLSVDEEATDID